MGHRKPFHKHKLSTFDENLVIANTTPDSSDPDSEWKADNVLVLTHWPMGDAAVIFD